MNTFHGPSERPDASRRLVRTLFEQRWTALLFFVAFFGFVMLIAYQFPPLYKVQAKVLVKAGRQMTPLLQTPLVSGGGGKVAATMEDVNSEIEILTSRPVFEAAVDKLGEESPEAREKKRPKSLLANAMSGLKAFAEDFGLVPKVEGREQRILQLRNKLAVEPIPLSNVIEVSYSSFAPRSAARSVNAALEAYIERHTEVHSSDGAYEFFRARAAEYEAELEVVDEALTRFRTESGGGDLALKRSLLLSRLTEAEERKQSLQAVAEGEEELMLDTGLLEDREISAARERLLDLKLSLAEIRSRYNDGSPEVRAIQSQIELAREELAGLLARLEISIASSVASLSARLREVELAQAEFDRLTHQQARLRSSVDQYTSKAEEERISIAMNEDRMVSVRILEWASVPQKASFPNRFLLAMFGILMGIPGAICAALLRGYFDRKVGSVDDVEEGMGIPALAALPRMGAWRFRHELPAPVLSAARRILVELEKRDPVPKVLHLAASGRKQGVRALALGIAQVAVDEGRRVVVAFVERPHWKWVAENGLAEAAPSASSPAEERGAPEGAATPARERRAPATLDLAGMSFPEIRAAIAKAGGEHDLVVLAGPPTNEGDAGAYAALADASILVVSGSGVHIDVARRAARILERTSPELLGAVLTRRRDPVPGFVYSRL